MVTRKIVKYVQENKIQVSFAPNSSGNVGIRIHLFSAISRHLTYSLESGALFGTIRK
jgi:hypothetical protein